MDDDGRKASDAKASCVNRGESWGAALACQRPSACYLQSGQHPVPMSRVAAEALVAAIATRTVASAKIIVFIVLSFRP